MVPSPSKIKRAEDMEAKTAQIDELIGEIVPMLEDLDEKGLRDVKADLQTRVIAAKHSLAKESTTVYFKNGRFHSEKP